MGIRFSLQTVLVASTVVCVAAAVCAAFPEPAGELSYFLLLQAPTLLLCSAAALARRRDRLLVFASLIAVAFTAWALWPRMYVRFNGPPTTSQLIWLDLCNEALGPLLAVAVCLLLWKVVKLFRRRPR